MDPGAVLIEAQTHDGCVTAVRVSARRPQLVRLLLGRPATALSGIVPLLYSVCASAQRAAVVAAIAAARGQAPESRHDPDVAAEASREHLLAVFRVPGAAAEPHLARARRALADPAGLRTVLGEELLGTPLEDWLEITTLQELVDWATRSEAPLARDFRRRLALEEPATHASPLLPVVDAAATLVEWPVLGASFAERPTWRGAPAETGPVAREAARPLVRDLGTRPLLQHWVARLVELGRSAAGDPASPVGRVSAVAAVPGRGRSAVETARGTLLHEVTLTGDRVVDYVVVAPTEWNFHADGAARRWLQGMRSTSDEQTLALAQRVVEALDPCVECRYDVSGR